MSVRVRIPTPLQKLTGDQAEVTAEGTTIREVIASLEKKYPGMEGRLCDEKKRLRRFVNVYVNEEDIRFLNQEATPVKEGDEISIIPAIAGGSVGAGCVPLASGLAGGLLWTLGVGDDCGASRR